MAIHRGIQSAIFFYLSCAPCADARYRKRRKQEAVWNRAERDALEEEMPDMYRHPEPSSTNPYWQSEIALGPALTSRGGNRNKARGNTGGGKSSKEMLSCNGNVAGATTTSLVDSNGLQRHQQQREDEMLWGTTMTATTGMVDGAGSTVRRPARAARQRGKSNETSTTQGTSSSYAAAYSDFRSPPISDLLPPIVRTVHSREEIAWMMQPPPVADVMSGKREGGTRSGASSRQGSARMARTVSRGSSGTASSVLHVVTESPKALPVDYHRRPTSRSGETLEIIPAASIRRVASRPPLLSTIASEGNVPLAKGDDGGGGQEAPLSLIDSAKSQHHPTTSIKPHHRTRSNSSDPKQKGRVLQGRVFTTAAIAPSSPPPSSDPEVIFADGEVREELFDSWYTPDFELDRWVHEHTRREGIRERWSFDV